MRLRTFHAIALLPVLLSACVGVPAHVYLSQPERDKLASTEVAVPVSQSEIYVYVPPSQIAAAGGGGLLLALIDAGVDSVRTSKAEDAVKPLRDSLVDYDFDNTLQADLKDSLGQVAWMHAGDFHVVKTVSNESLDGVLANSKDSAVLFATADYHLSNDANILDITVHASLFPASADLRALKPAKNGRTVTGDLSNAIYQNTFIYDARLAGTGDDRASNIALLSADHGAALRKEMQLGETKLAQMVATDIQRAETDAMPAGRDVTVTGSSGLAMSGQAVGSDRDGTVVRFKDGSYAFAAHTAY
jgi:hypothetical protein